MNQKNMMKYLVFALFLVNIFACVKNDCKKIEGISIADETLIFATDENFPYCKLLEGALRKERRSIQRLARKNFDTSAGLGHGVVIVELIHKIGEGVVAKIFRWAPKQERQALKLNLEVGLAYTQLKAYRGKSIQKAFPKLYQLVKP